MTGRERVYLLLAVLGAAAPLTVFGIFLAEHGLDLGRFFEDVFASEVAGMTFADLAVSSLVFWVWMAYEAPRVGLGSWWPFVVANLLVGLSFALPLFLYFRERALAGRPAGAAVGSAPAVPAGR